MNGKYSTFTEFSKKRVCHKISKISEYIRCGNEGVFNANDWPTKIAMHEHFSHLCLKFILSAAKYLFLCKISFEYSKLKTAHYLILDHYLLKFPFQYLP